MSTLNPLGECEQCHGNLCVSGQQVNCERCGQVVADHSITRDWPATKEEPKVFDIPAQHYAATVNDRLIAAERKIETLQHSLASVEKARLSFEMIANQRLAALEGTRQMPKR